MDVRLPALGETVESGDVLRVLISPGETVRKDQPVLELETDKATIEVPASVEGVVEEVKVKAGDTVAPGQVIFTIGEGVPAAPKAPEPAQAAGSAGAPAKAAAADVSPPGTGRAEEAPPESTAEPRAKGVKAPSPESAAAAAPSVRRLARELGVSIGEVAGRGPAGRIGDDDVKAHARRLVEQAAREPEVTEPPLPDFARWGEIERKPMTGIRRRTAERLSVAWSAIPHVTQYDLADLTELNVFRKERIDETGEAPTVTAMLVKVVAAALRSFPVFATAVDMAAGEIVFRKYVHIGVAVDTDRGLLVPVIRHADRKGLIEISAELERLADKARAHTLTLDDMQGGVFTITNLGGLGGTSFAPIVNWPEVGILGASRASTQPVFMEGAFRPRVLLPLSLSYDHRVIDGADAVRFLRWIVAAIEQPTLISPQG